MVVLRTKQYRTKVKCLLGILASLSRRSSKATMIIISLCEKCCQIPARICLPLIDSDSCCVHPWLGLFTDFLIIPTFLTYKRYLITSKSHLKFYSISSEVPHQCYTTIELSYRKVVLLLGLQPILPKTKRQSCRPDNISWYMRWPRWAWMLSSKFHS